MLLTSSRFLILSVIFGIVGYSLAGSLEYNGEPETRERSTKGSSRISGATIVRDPHKWRPYMNIRVFLKAAKYHNCNGALLTDRLILTSADCVIGKSLEFHKDIHQIKVTSTTRGSQSFEQEVEKVCIPKFDDADANPNIAVLRMRSVYQFKELNARPVLLPTKPIGYSDIAHVVSIGMVDWDDKDPTQGLLRELPMRKRSKCKLAPNRPDVLCFQASDPNHQGNTCSRDSGAPLLVPTKEGNYTLYGTAIIRKENVLTCKEGTVVDSYFSDIYYLVPEVRNLMKECN